MNVGLSRRLSGIVVLVLMITAMASAVTVVLGQTESIEELIRQRRPLKAQIECEKLLQSGLNTAQLNDLLARARSLAQCPVCGGCGRPLCRTCMGSGKHYEARNSTVQVSVFEKLTIGEVTVLPSAGPGIPDGGVEERSLGGSESALFNARTFGQLREQRVPYALAYYRCTQCRYRELVIVLENPDQFPFTELETARGVPVPVRKVRGVNLVFYSRLHRGVADPVPAWLAPLAKCPNCRGTTVENNVSGHAVLPCQDCGGKGQIDNCSTCKSQGILTLQTPRKSPIPPIENRPEASKTTPETENGELSEVIVVNRLESILTLELRGGRKQHFMVSPNSWKAEKVAKGIYDSLIEYDGADGKHHRAMGEPFEVWGEEWPSLKMALVVGPSESANYRFETLNEAQIATMDAEGKNLKLFNKLGVDLSVDFVGSSRGSVSIKKDGSASIKLVPGTYTVLLGSYSTGPPAYALGGPVEIKPLSDDGTQQVLRIGMGHHGDFPIRKVTTEEYFHALAGTKNNKSPNRL